jgi:hypothetical protein
MKKILLSTIVIATVATASSNEIEALKAQMNVMQTKIAELETKAPSLKVKKHETSIKSHVPILKFSGTHYLGFVSGKNANGNKDNKFETRRNYLQVKAYMKENPKDYMRITLDTHNDSAGESGVRLKYAYLYLDNVLPNTGVELGQVHRPWIDYEEHNSWSYRSISKVLVEEGNAAHLTNSADRGFNLKTKTPYFSSEIGLFNGEGYHNTDSDLTNGSKLSGEWRATVHLLGTGKQKAKQNLQYSNLSFFGQENRDSAKHGNQDLNWMGIHAVYNQADFLLSAQYIDVRDGDMSSPTKNKVYQGDGYSVNGEYRFAKDWNAIARFDYFEVAKDLGHKKRALAGVTYKYNKNVEFIANYLNESGSLVNGYTADTKKKVHEDTAMLTAQIEW